MGKKTDQAASVRQRTSLGPQMLHSRQRRSWRMGQTRGEPAMSRFVEAHFHSAPVRAEMKALDLRTRRLPFGTLLISVIAGANTVSVVAMLLGL
jgi:hypothetical protein